MLQSPMFQSFLRASTLTASLGFLGCGTETGPQGKTGPVGYEGPEGPEGSKGKQGIQGPVGPMGSQGIQGEQGPQGFQGPVGAVGPAGPTGPMGNPFNIAACHMVTVTGLSNGGSFVQVDAVCGAGEFLLNGGCELVNNLAPITKMIDYGNYPVLKSGSLIEAAWHCYFSGEITGPSKQVRSKAVCCPVP